MTIDEAIKIIKEKMACDYNISGCDTCNISSCEDRDIVIQLAELLEELKKRRSEDYGYMADIHQSIGYRKALDDIKEELMKNGFICTQHALDVFDGIAKQLKEGN